MKSLIDNEREDEYLYQVLVFTGQRRDAATKSKVRSTDGDGERDVCDVDFRSILFFRAMTVTPVFDD